jgi:hypothetical protein
MFSVFTQFAGSAAAATAEVLRRALEEALPALGRC